ncbi:Palmitoyltransferase erf2 [Cytospora mali]|uniref:Palmitoyltransferase n=1 Tax=Cytospora mali TaxID=578113 RepID=A0A194VBB1_CYTMA|nr:Palmitoyltransferase erf2 [Valsa mali var. pyri (nom. inval.)]
MASGEESGPNTPVSGPPAGDDDATFPQFLGHATGPPSIISSRMTDIGTEDGREIEARNPQRDSLAPSQSGTIRSQISSQRWPQSTPLRPGLSGKRGSLTASIGGSSIGTAGRPPSSTSRSHVPSVSSHAFFRPMSSQKLQAQRGAARPSTMNRTPEAEDTLSDEVVMTTIGANVVRHSIQSQPNSQGRQFTDDELPQSRGTEMTAPETIDSATANTSPTAGHYPHGSLSESVRPLHKQKEAAESKGLAVNLDKSYKTSGQPSPLTPLSFRSSFLLPGRSNQGENASNRNFEGGEKLGSVSSSPGVVAEAVQPKPRRIRPAKPERNPDAGRNWEYFLGNTVFCMGGRFQNTKSRPVNIATGAFIIIPCILFFVFSARDLWYDVSPAVPIFFAYLAFICVSSFLHASTSDPGILPRNLHQNPPADANEDPLRLAPPSTDWTLIKSAESSTAAMEVPTKYCKTCQIWRPPRTHHCRMCDNCVETADHHCVWLNNCVGRRNYRYFFTFVSSATVLSLYLLAASLAQILVYRKREGVSFSQAINHDAVPFAMVFYGFIGFLYPAALTTYHMFLMARGETTREFLNSHKFVKKDRYRAFTQGTWYKNWSAVLCRPRPPTYYHFKKRYHEGDQRLAELRIKERRRQAKTQQQQQEGVELGDVPPQKGFQGGAALRKETEAPATT